MVCKDLFLGEKDTKSIDLFPNSAPEHLVGYIKVRTLGSFSIKEGKEAYTKREKASKSSLSSHQYPFL